MNNMYLVLVEVGEHSLYMITYVYCNINRISDYPVFLCEGTKNILGWYCHQFFV